MTNVLWTSWLKPRGRASWTLARAKTTIIHRKRKRILNIALLLPKKIEPVAGRWGGEGPSRTLKNFGSVSVFEQSINYH